MHFEAMLRTTSFGLTEGSVYERLRRHPSIQFDPYIAHASLIYDEQSSAILEQIHREYLDIGQRHRVPMLTLTDTWRASQKRVEQSRFHYWNVNLDNARFLGRLCNSYGLAAQPIFIGGQVGPSGDAYRPEEALTRSEAEAFHAPQIEALVEGQVDFLYASTLPALSEAQGIAAAMAVSGLPYLLSFVVRADGRLLDGTSLAQAIQMLDLTGPNPPTGYGINCVYPRVFASALTTLSKRDLQRVLIFQANTSARDPGELEHLTELETEEPEILGDLMMEAYREYGTLFMGGCCGTDTRHIESLARKHQEMIH
jgi:S-methylmethionine-dependent homocysteine/selenocysteine methylase